MVVNGVTVMLLPDIPLLHVTAPDAQVAVKVLDEPEQIVVGLATTTGAPNGLTVIVCCAVPIHVPVPHCTLYVCVVNGCTVILAVVWFVLHNIVELQPFTVKILLSFGHIVVFVAEILMLGFGVTVTVTGDDEVHDPLVQVAV
mgnify:CR=1 FL=1